MAELETMLVPGSSPLPTGQAFPNPSASESNLVVLNRFETLVELNNIFDEAWKAVAEVDYEAGHLSAAAIGQGTESKKSRKPLKVKLCIVEDDSHSVCATLIAVTRGRCTRLWSWSMSIMLTLLTHVAQKAGSPVLSVNKIFTQLNRLT